MVRNRAWILLLAVNLPMTAGCTRHLVETPNLLRDQDPQLVYDACPLDCRSPDAAVLYATDRTIVANGKNPATYGYGRANRLAFGIANVSLSRHPTWDGLIQASTQTGRGREFELKLTSFQEVGRIKPVFEHAHVGESGLVLTKEVVHELETQRAQFHDLLQKRLAQTKQKDVYLFVHGYNNTFDDAVFRAAEVWHFMGRVGVPIAYTWPAGRGGIRGYAYDRESGEFTVSHLRRFIQTVAECPDVERVHLIAHSRGCDVAISALRELHLTISAQGKTTQRELKLENLVLAAPDIDEEVFMQRSVGENLLQAAKRHDDLRLRS